MRKKATLLIIHLHKLYTGKQITTSMLTISNAYIGIFHDEIIEVGTGAYHHLIDKDTRIIDALGCIAVPGFIDCQCGSFDPHQHDMHRLLHTHMMKAMSHGVTTANVPCEAPSYVYQHYAYELFWNHPCRSQYPRIGIEEILHQKKEYKRFCICGSYDSYDPLLSAQLYYLKYHPSPIQLLKALCVYPAQCMNLTDRGVIERGKLGDIVILNAGCIEDVFSSLQQNCIRHVIKRGVRIYPNVIV